MGCRAVRLGAFALALLAAGCTPEPAVPPPAPRSLGAPLAVEGGVDGAVGGTVSVDLRGGRSLPLVGAELLFLAEPAFAPFLAARVEAARAGLEKVAAERVRAGAEYRSRLAEADQADQAWKAWTASEARRRVELQFRRPGGLEGVQALRRALMEEKQAAWSRAGAAASRAHQAERALEALERQAAAFRDGPFFLRGLPPAARSVSTGPDGSYAVRLEPGRYALVAVGDRQQGVVAEGYVWLLWLQVEAGPNPPLVLSSANLHGTDCASCAVAVRGLEAGRPVPARDSIARRTP